MYTKCVNGASHSVFFSSNIFYVLPLTAVLFSKSVSSIYTAVLFNINSNLKYIELVGYSNKGSYQY